MAEGLGISPSYLNLIERNQRPLTVQLRAASWPRPTGRYRGIAGRGAGNTVAALKEVFSDPLLAGELPGDQELIEMAEPTPNAAAAMAKLYRAYREQADRLSDLSDLLAREGRATGALGRAPADRRGARDLRAAAEPLRRDRGRRPRRSPRCSILAMTLPVR